MDIKQSFESRLKNIEIFLDKCIVYFNIVKEYVKGKDPAEYKRVEDALGQVREIINRIIATDIDGDPAESLFRIYDDFKQLNYYMNFLLSFNGNDHYTKSALLSKSTTYTTNIHNVKHIARQMYDLYVAASVAEDNLIFDYCYDKINPGKQNTEKLVRWLVDKNINKFTINMMGKLIKDSRGDSTRKLELIIERQIDLLLAADRRDISQYHGTQGILVRYGLVPGISMPLEALFAQIRAADITAPYDATKTPEENISAIKYGVIYMNHSSSSAIEFNLNGLIDEEYIIKNDLKTNPQSGLTKKILNRFTTMARLASGTTAKKTQIFNRGPKYICIDTINEQSYRLLMQRGSISIDDSGIRGILGGLTLRPSRYHQIVYEKIKDVCFDKHADFILQKYKDDTLVRESAYRIKSKIMDAFFLWFHNAETHISSFAELKRVCTDEKLLSEITLDALVFVLNIDVKTTREFMLTYIVIFNGIIHDFVKEVERRWLEMTSAERIFRENSGMELKKIMREIAGRELEAAIDELEKRKRWSDYEVGLKEYFLKQKELQV